MDSRITWDEMKTQCPAFEKGNFIHLRDGVALVVTNGSRWAGEGPLPLVDLFRLLKSETLEEFSSVTFHPRLIGGVQPPEDAVLIFGNFRGVSHVHQIYTNSKRLVKKYLAMRKYAIKEND